MTRRIWIFESEIRAIAEETLRWDTETGGDLFGDWSDEPTILLATRLGPSSERGLTECRFDLSYLEQIGTTLAVDWGLRYLGDWHSHGRSDVTFPSRTDRNRIGQLIQRNGFDRFVEFITAKPLTPTQEREIAVHGYDFPAARWFSPDALEIAVIAGISPVREIFTLRRDGALGQEWLAWQSASLSSITGFGMDHTRTSELVDHWREHVARRAFRQFVSALEDHFEEPIVDRLVANEREFSVQTTAAEFQLAFGAYWPFPMRRVTRAPMVGRRCNISGIPNVTALQPELMLAICRRISESGHDERVSVDAARFHFGPGHS